MNELMIQILVAIVAGLFGLGPVIIEMITNRARRGSSAQKIAILNDNLDFLEKWSTLYEQHQLEGQTDQDKATSARIQSDLVRILAQYQALKEREKEQQRQVVTISWPRRMLLLFLPHTARGWFYHTLFYVLVLFSATMIFSEVQNPVIDPITGESELMALLFGMVIIFSLPAIFLVRRANKERNRFIEQQQAADV